MTDIISGAAIGLLAGVLIGAGQISDTLGLVTSLLGIGGSLLSIKYISSGGLTSDKMSAFAAAAVVGLIITKLIVNNDVGAANLERFKAKYTSIGLSQDEANQLAVAQYFGRNYSEIITRPSTSRDGCEAAKAILASADPLDINALKLFKNEWQLVTDQLMKLKDNERRSVLPIIVQIACPSSAPPTPAETEKGHE